MNDFVIRVFVDALDDNTAFLVVGDRRLSVPRQVVPPAAREGSWLQIAVSDDDGVAKDIADRRERLEKSDPGGDITL